VSSPKADPARFGEAADAILDRIKPILACSVELQGAVIADLAAIWIAGHRAEDRAEGDLFREELIELLAEHVRALVLMYLGDADG